MHHAWTEHSQQLCENATRGAAEWTSCYLWQLDTLGLIRPLGLKHMVSQAVLLWNRRRGRRADILDRHPALLLRGFRVSRQVGPHRILSD